MHIQYIGTAAAEAFPALFCQCAACVKARKMGGKNIRGRSGALIDGTLMIDFPPDIYFQSLKFDIDMGKIRDIIVTHTHSDHFCVGELMLRDPEWNAHFPAGRMPVHIYGNKDVGLQLNLGLKKSFGRLDRELALFTEAKPFECFEAGDCRITPLEAIHDVREDCLLYIIEKNGIRILYAHDTSGITQQDWSFIKGLYFNLVSLDCTNGDGESSEVHMGIKGDAETKERLAQMGCIDNSSRIVINHFSHNCGLLHSELECMTRKYGFIVAYDGMTIDI